MSKIAEMTDMLDKNLPSVLSVRQLAIYFDCYQSNGKPATKTILDWLRTGRIPQPDITVSRKAMYWKAETITSFFMGDYNGDQM